MREFTVIINFFGGIISPGMLYNILVAATKANIKYVKFGLRQQLFLHTSNYNLDTLTAELKRLSVDYQIDINTFPNIVSAYPAEEIFARKAWLTEGVYKDILDMIDFKPLLKINICGSNQSFTPMLTGNINWIASTQNEHYWHLIIRFPKTNVIYQWDNLVYTNTIAKLSKRIEEIIFSAKADFIDNKNSSGPKLFEQINTEHFILKRAEKPVVFPKFNLPYYEGINPYNNKFWLGIYRRDELFSIHFLKELCVLCTASKLGQICCTPWKSLIVKGITEQDKNQWEQLLQKFNINMRHAANELNFQVEDNSQDSLQLKNYLVKHLNTDDTRTMGICFGIKAKRKSEIFSSILIRKRYLIDWYGLKIFPVFDILRSRDFNPNERTANIVSSGNLKFMLPEQLRRTVYKFHAFRSKEQREIKSEKNFSQSASGTRPENLYQCSKCFTVYNEHIGETENDISPGTLFDHLPESYRCVLCESDKNAFVKVEQENLNYVKP